MAEGFRGQVENLQILPFTSSLDQTRQEDRVAVGEENWEASALRPVVEAYTHICGHRELHQIVSRTWPRF